MAKALVFEGCPACETKIKGFAGFEEFGERAITPYATRALTGGAIGAGGVIAVDMFLPRLLPTLSPFVRSLLTGAVLFGTAFMLKDKYPDVATGLAIGGGGIVVYKIVGSLLGKIIAAPRPTAGLGYDQDEYDQDQGEMVEVEESPYGVLIPEELGQEEIIIE